MKLFEYALIVIVGSLSFSIIWIIMYDESSNIVNIPKWNSLKDIKQQHFENCDEFCKINAEKNGYFCTEMQSDNYVCRPPREITHSDAAVQTLSAIPPEYGEFAYFPEGNADIRMFDIANVTILDKNTKRIQVDFGYHFPTDIENEFSYSSSLVPGQTFVSHCIDESGTAHLVEYLDIFEMRNKTYVEFWGSHVTIPYELVPCEMPDLIKYTMQLGMSLGIDFDMK